MIAENTLNMMGLTTLASFFLAFMWLMVVITIGIYIYVSFAMMVIAKKLNKDNPWLVWIPIVNLFYIPVMADYPWYLGFLWFLGAIPVVGWIIPLALVIWWYWKISEGVKKPGWLGILMAIPIVNLIVIGILAWA